MATEHPERMSRYIWSRLLPLQVGRYAEYFVKMEFTMMGYEVFSSEVDDRGIDFVARREPGPFLEVQVKSLRKGGYIFCQKSKTRIDPHRLVAVVIFVDEKEPELFLVPMTAWKVPDALLVDHDFHGRTSNPEYGLNISKKNRQLLERFRFDRTLDGLT